MRVGLRSVAAVLLLAGAACLGQQWEVNGLAGGSAYLNPSISNRFGSATVGFTRGAVVGASLVQHYYRYISGEIRWAFQAGSDLKVGSGGGLVKFDGSTHAIHCDWLIHAQPQEAWVRPFVAAGAGFKAYRGTGAEHAYQPLSQFALLTRTTEWKPLISVGGGLRVRLSERLSLAAEVRDYLTPFPKNVIVPVGGATVGGWLHDFVPSLALGIRF